MEINQEGSNPLHNATPTMGILKDAIRQVISETAKESGVEIQFIDSPTRVIKADGTKKEIQPQNGTDFSLEELQKYVDGYIQVIPLRNQEDEILVINEDGKERYPTNKAATGLAMKYSAIFRWDWIDGDVVLCKNSEVL